MATPMELYCWRGDWGLPSVDAECLVVVTYAKFAGAPVKVRSTCVPWRSPTGRLPALRSDGEVISSPYDILNHLQKKGFHLDVGLTRKEEADAKAFVSLIRQKLLPAVMHTFWGDTVNYSEFTRPWLAGSLPFPMGLILPGQVRGSATERFTQMVTKSSDATDEEYEEQMYLDATECLRLLSQSLGSRKYFFQDQPSSLDAVVFAHVAPLIKARLPNSRLHHHVKNLDNLCLLCHHVLHQYFPHVDDDNYNSSQSKPPPANGPARSPDADGEVFTWREQILSVLFVSAAMIGYAFLSGLVTVEWQAPGHVYQVIEDPKMEMYGENETDDE
uniref:metaxin-1-like n=1 Tax=Myxine glutinosa TaxID=7769 RepID=UPI00358FD4EF